MLMRFEVDERTETKKEGVKVTLRPQATPEDVKKRYSMLWIMNSIDDPWVKSLTVGEVLEVQVIRISDLAGIADRAETRRLVAEETTLP